MPNLSFIDSLLRRGKRSIPPDILKASPVVTVGEGEAILLTYTSVVDKMKVFSAFIREGLENGDLVNYTYPDEESEIVRARLKEHGIDVEKYERKGALVLESLNEFFMPNSKFDKEKAIGRALDDWAEAKKKGFKHVRDLEDLGDFSFINGQWRKYIADYWLDPRWDDPNVSEWVKSQEAVGAVYDSFLMEITAINVERMTETQVIEILKTFGGGQILSRGYFIDLYEDMDSFAATIGLDHGKLVGRKILLEFDPSSNYEKVVDSLAKESRANVEPLFVFTSSTSPIRRYLAKQPSIKFFSTSFSTSIPKSTSENEVLLPAKNVPLILDALSTVLETYVDANVCFIFDILSDLLTTMEQEKTFTFLRHALNMLSSEKITSVFLFNTSAHELQVVSQLKSLFSNQLTYNKDGMEVVKAS